METAFEREELLLGREAVERLQRARVAVFGLGGVGGHAAEALVRCGVGAIDLIDGDTYSSTNLNRQLFATRATLGREKTRAGAERLQEINPALRVEEHPFFYTPDTADRLDFTRFDYILDCIDMVTGKLAIIERAVGEGVPIISAMGAGNKLDPTAFRVADIYETSVCPLARVMRRELKKRNVRRLKVVYSQEPPLTAPAGEHPLPGSVAFVPSVAGLILAGEAVKDLTGVGNDRES
ncbi:tRNA threonylcarbamoyladenosine dehydratase [Acutalibacter sp. 1XD8-33]|uniref:tRNA threonylcarbamoyladenosine dehydratase n=1 Tax=Acutalibacter sp. 1XD8-33 TaxID=2320081 RepID=UPI000EA0BB2C|nr:tRNA threonylcarbamoyladenosine dehydratase [Acutalibacter sp. 1XD8-33]RKJ42245.1 tRNA threonylcarbamoyladenosine dehydratase [Acutalibacter sp. 1XD8-33]